MDKKQKDARAAGTGKTRTADPQRSQRTDAPDPDAQAGSVPGYQSGRNQILITVALLYPDAEFEV
jgi:hypothetical protein